MTRAEAKKIQEEVSAAVRTIAEKYGMEMTKGNCRYGETMFKMSIEMQGVERGANGVNMTSKFAADYNHLARHSVTDPCRWCGRTEDGNCHACGNTGAAIASKGGYLNLPSGRLGTVITERGVKYAFAGLAVSRKKYPFAFVEVDTGKMVFFSQDVKRALFTAFGVDTAVVDYCCDISTAGVR